jgi:hypothetical protein
MKGFQMASIPENERLNPGVSRCPPCSLAASNARLAQLNGAPPCGPNRAEFRQAQRCPANSFGGSNAQTLQRGWLPFE